MIWRLLNRLFGWDYIIWENSCDSGVARIHKDKAGTVWYFRYKLTGVVDFAKDKEIKVWLTCTPDKYISKDETDEGTN